ncbi:T9SS type A sorting domain-containing protein [Flavobacterium selenitireducens]|uniref:T9SS type A sorting domain-containing protein n=1 Tax=Flavobacterium selenitireducens TaxID=2722704 RepID=UPI00168B8893|nr:T9SS type A sorting domain-containing protein [Flavobacterium selenitireducens]MBD3581323.1 T9SS type A sorting domain-containing protein [Flavobacterium selenitireducens]
MKLFRNSRILLLLLGLLLSPSALSQDIQWEKSYGGKHADYLFDAVPTADYGFILAGSSLSDKTGNKTSVNKGNLDYWVWKMDEHGELVWQKSFGGSGIDLLQSIKLTTDGGFLLAGTSNSPKSDDKKEDCKGDNDYWVIKLDAGGGEQWQRTIGGFGSDVLISAIQTKDGGVLLGGTSSSDANGDKSAKSKGATDIWLVRLDNSGIIKWQRTYGGRHEDELRSMIQSVDGGFLLGAYSFSSESGDKISKCNGAGDFWILKLDDAGEMVWQKTYGGAKDDQLKVVIQTSDGHYIAAGNSVSGSGFSKATSSRHGSDFWVIKMDVDGNGLWQESYNFGKYDILTSVIENNDGTLLIGGHAKSEPNRASDPEGTNDYIALKIKADGTEIWNKTFGSDGEDILYKLIETRDGGYLLAGTSNPQAVKTKKRSNKNKDSLSNIGDDGNMAIANTAQQNMDSYVNDARDAANDYYKEQSTTVTDAANDAVGQKEGPLKFGVNAPGDLLQQGDAGNRNLFGAGNGQNRNSNDTSAKKSPASRQKANNLGRNDFWVVKLKDKDKKEKARRHIEAFPNPANDFTNVVVSYEFEKGTATIFDISGRQLQSFPISERTVPVSLNGLPEGIYIVNIKTNRSDDSVKVMKTINK